MTSDSPSFPGLRSPQVIEALQKRSALLQCVRQFFIQHGYWEVETQLLSHETCIDLWIEPVECPIGTANCYLQTSPEFAMKRLVASGATAIFQICKAFRNHERGENHNLEFTMLEWYRVDDSYHDQMTFVEALIRTALSFAEQQQWIPDEATALQFHRLNYEAAFQQFAEISALEATDLALIERAKQAGLELAQNEQISRDDVLNYLLATVVEPKLTEFQAVFLYDYPASQCALAQVRNGSQAVAERFELYLGEVELCNGYQELTDASELRRRMIHQNQLRAERGLRTFQSESRLVRAMESGFPKCSGVALGFDRLVAKCLGLNSIQDLIAFPFDVA